MPNPRVSIIIPICNVTHFLKEAIESVVSQNQSDLEMIVVNDGSTFDNSQKIIRICATYPQVKLTHQANAGQAIARQTGVQNASGEYIIFLDADDILLPGAIEFLTRGMHENPSAIAVYGTKIRMDVKGDFITHSLLPRAYQAASGDVLPALLKGAPLFSHGNICIRRSALLKVAFPENIRQGEDWVTWCHLALLGDIIYLGPRPLLALRHHSNNVSSEVFENPSELLAMFDRVFKSPAIIEAIDRKNLNDYQTVHLHNIQSYLYYSYRDRKQYFRSWKHFFIWKYVLPSLPRERIRIIHIVKWFYAGGAERIVSNILANSDHSKYEHYILSLSDQGERLSEIQHTLKIPYRSFNISWGKHHVWRDFRKYYECFKLISKLKPDLIKTWLPPANLAGGIIGKLLRIPVVWGVHNVHPIKPYARDVRWQNRLHAFIPKTIICCAPPSYDTCLEMGYRRDKLNLIMNGTDPQIFQYSRDGRNRIRDELGISGDTLLIGMAAEGNLLKRHPHFLIAAKLFLIKHPNTKFVLCGNYTDQGNERLISQVRFLEIESHVYLLGIRNDMADIYSALDIHTLNSYHEAFGLAVIEGLACETLSVATAVGMMPEFLENVGEIYPVEDSPKGLVAAWERLLALPESEKVARRKRGRTRVIENYSIQKTTAAYDRIFETYAKP